MHSDAHGAHKMNHMASSSHVEACMPVDRDAQGQHADCGMTVCCFSDLAAPCPDLRAGAVSAAYARLTADPALQADPDRADKLPRRT